MIERYTGDGDSITHEQLVSAIDISILATQRTVGIEAKSYYELSYTNEEELSDFPAKLSFKNNGDIVLNVHKESLDGHAEYISAQHQDVTTGDIAKLYIAGAIIPHMFIAHVAPRNHDAAALDKLYGHMASADSLCEDIANSLLEIGANEELLRLTVLSRSEDDIAKINRMRLAVGIMVYDTDDAGLEPAAARQSISFSKRLRSVFHAYLSNIDIELNKHALLAEKFGMDRHGSDRKVMDDLSPLEIAAAFPMSLGEVSTIARLVAAKK